MRTYTFLAGASIALYMLSQALPAAQGQWHANDLQILHYNPDACNKYFCDPSNVYVTGWKLSYAGLEGFLFFGAGFRENPFCETCWLANPLLLSALAFFYAKKFRTAAWLAAGAQIAAVVILLPNTTFSSYIGKVIGPLEIGYWCWLASITALSVGCLLAVEPWSNQG